MIIVPPEKIQYSKMKETQAYINQDIGGILDNRVMRGEFLTSKSSLNTALDRSEIKLSGTALVNQKAIDNESKWFMQ